jgi:hypothetical protein
MEYLVERVPTPGGVAPRPQVADDFVACDPGFACGGQDREERQGAAPGGRAVAEALPGKSEPAQRDKSVPAREFSAI